MQPANTNELQAVITMLSTIGEAPIASLAGRPAPTHPLADQVLTEVVRETPVQGWYINLDCTAVPGVGISHGDFGGV